MNGPAQTNTEDGSVAREGIRGAADPEFLEASEIRGGNFSLEADTVLLLRLASFVETGQLVVPIEGTISLEQAPEAVAASLNGRARGKTVIRI